jgi:D-alanyl-D-alanine carboxypeptidase/D-alanyl-D-alanine-endopeptidase (penicillin-binding protein 4)
MTKTRYRLIALLVLCCVGLSAASGICAQTLSQKIDAILKDPALAHGLQGILIKSLKTNETLYEHNADDLMIPASNFKLLVSSTILEQLGPDFTFKTEVYTSGKLENGVLDGDVILKGGGDPVLLTVDLTDLAKQLKASGILRIKGSIIADDSLFDDQRLGWGWCWDGFPYYYSAEISALNLNRNTVDVFVTPGKDVGARAEVKLVPETDYLTIDSSATTGKPGSTKTIWVTRTLGQNIIKIGGSIAQDEKATTREAPVTMEEPQLYAGCVFAAELARQGIKADGSVKAGKLPEGSKLVAAHTSPPLSKILALLNKPSDNLIAEVLLKALGAFVKGTGSSDTGADVEKEFLKKVGLDMSELSIVDGSGLSRLDYVSPRNLVTLLAYMRSSKNSKVFIDSLPIAGVDGSLYYRMKNTSAQKNVRAKSGFVGRVSTLSGYVNTKSGEPLVFSIMMNHHLCGNSQATLLQDKICVLLADLP